jgi:low affinity Fe/Cu permease
MRCDYPSFIVGNSILGQFGWKSDHFNDLTFFIVYFSENINYKFMNTKKIDPQQLKRAKIFNKVSGAITRAAGSATASISSFLLILVWSVGGLFFGFTDTWQLIINTLTTIITFLMVFVIQQSQNKDTMAIQLKLNELIACNEKASNRLVDIEDLTEGEILLIKEFYKKLSVLSAKEDNLRASHSLDEAEDIHIRKSKFQKKQEANTNS